MSSVEDRRSCYVFMCDRFPACKRAVSCCAVDPDRVADSIKEEECYIFEDRPLYIEKPKRVRYGL